MRCTKVQERLLKIPVQPVMMLEETASYMEGGMVEGPHYTRTDF